MHPTFHPTCKIFDLDEMLDVFATALNATIALKLDTWLKIAHHNIVLLVKGSITFLFVNLELIWLRKITQVKTRHLKTKL